MISKKSQKYQKYIEKKNTTSSSTNYGGYKWYCQDCSLIMTSKLQAEEHFFGKRHQSMIKSKDLLHSGLRETQPIMPAKKDIFTYKKLQNLGNSTMSTYWKPKCCNSTSHIIPPPGVLTNWDNLQMNFIGSPQDQLPIKFSQFPHLQIYKGIKGCLKYGRTDPIPIQYKFSASLATLTIRDNILQTVIKSEKKTFYFSDLSIYRTPSGKYYCQPCNITVNSQTQFLQHSESRKHRHKASRASFKVK